MFGQESYKKSKKNKVRIQTIIDEYIYKNIIEKYIEEYGHLNRLLEEALLLFDKCKRSEKIVENDYDKLLIRLKNEVGLTALGFRAFEYIMAGQIEKAIYENGIEYAIEWYFGKPISEISLTDCLTAIKEIWIATNRVHNVSINDLGKEIHVFFNSKIGPHSDKVFCEALKIFLESTYNVKVSYKIKPHGYTLSIMV